MVPLRALITCAVIGHAPGLLLAQDCNGNSVPDGLDIASGTSQDCNGNGIPDECDRVPSFSFPRATEFALESRPYTLTSGDLDGDGDLDLVVTLWDSGAVEVLPNRGDGAFLLGVESPCGKNPASVVSGDLDSDGDADLAVTNWDSGDISVLLNLGRGTFLGQAVFPAGDGPTSLALGDLDSDGDPDLAAADWGSSFLPGTSVLVLMNQGGGRFDLPRLHPAGLNPCSVAMADLDQDLDLDLAVANQDSGSLSVLLNGGGGAFGPVVSYPTMNLPSSLAAGDLDGDGDADLAVAGGSEDLSIFPNDGTGTLIDPIHHVVDRFPSGVVLKDLDGNGTLDLAVASQDDGSLSVLGNWGGGVFAPAESFPCGKRPMSVVAGDFDGDGIADLATANFGSGTVSVLLNRPSPQSRDCNGNGVLDACEIESGEGRDCDGDGLLDACALAAGMSRDCNQNGLPDNCELEGNDCDRNGVPDSCEFSPDLCSRDPPGRPWPVVLNEIHYNPDGDEALEFLELRNTSRTPVDVGGWRFVEGISFEIPPGTGIPPQGFLVICREPWELAAEYGISTQGLLQWKGSELANYGGEIVLVDAMGIEVDRVLYDDRVPWDPRADSEGPSLQRICASGHSNDPLNWSAAGGATPGAPNIEERCPPALQAPRPVAFNEIHYHPPGDGDPDEEYLELVNTSSPPARIDISGWSIEGAIDFYFPRGTILEPGGFAVVCRNLEVFRSVHETVAVVGEFDGSLPNDGGTIALLDASGRTVDAVQYGTSGEWPSGPDGHGYSLERIAPEAPSGDPASWADSSLRRLPKPLEWHDALVTGPATSSRLYFYIEGPGEFLIDNVSIEAVDAPGVNLIPGGDFTTGLGAWECLGNHAGSRWSQDPGGPFYDEPVLHLISTGTGTGGLGSTVRVDTIQPLDTSGAALYRLSFSYCYLFGSPSLVARLSNSTESQGIYWFFHEESPLLSPGRPNDARQDVVPPLVTKIARWPLEPKSSDRTWIVAQVRGQATRVRLREFFNDVLRGEYEMRDDGLSHDGAVWDGIYGASVPPQPHNTAVEFTIETESAGGAWRMSPLPSDPEKKHGYYVNDNQSSKLPIIHLVTPSDTNPMSWLSALPCTTDRTFSLAHRGDLFSDIGIRRRSDEFCHAVKPYFEITFHEGREFRLSGSLRGQRKLYLQSLWDDKSLIRERLAWDLFQDMGQAHPSYDFVRVHAGGSYFGLYAAMEYPDGIWLERNGLDPDGNLYKAIISREEKQSSIQGYKSAYKKENNDLSDFTDIQTFLDTMHTTSAANLVAFFRKNVFEDTIIDYQVAQTLTNNSDYPHKNHFLYHDVKEGKWMVTSWNLELVYGKIWNGSFGGVLHDKMHNPGNTPWYATNVRGGGTGNHLLDKFFCQAGTYYRRAYLVRLWDALQEKYTLENHDAKIAELWDLLYDEQLEDIAKWGRSPATGDDPTAPAEFGLNLDRVYEHISIRRHFLFYYLQSSERFTGHDQLMITEIMYNPHWRESAFEYIELWNSSGKRIDVSGWTIEGFHIDKDWNSLGLEFMFPPGTVLEASEIVVVAKDPEAFRSRHFTFQGKLFGPYEGELADEGMSLRVKDAGPGYPATVDSVRYSSAGDWPPEGFALRSSIELTDVHPARNNDAGSHWRAVPGGNPGEIPGLPKVTFSLRRGDPNADGGMDLGDVLSILFHLFGGGPAPSCGKSEDADDDGSIGLTDAVFLLDFLFLGGPAPPPPFTECSADPTEDLLTCERYAPCE